MWIVEQLGRLVGKSIMEFTLSSYLLLALHMNYLKLYLSSCRDRMSCFRVLCSVQSFLPFCSHGLRIVSHTHMRTRALVKSLSL